MCQPFAVQVSEVIFDCNVTPSVPVKKLTNQTVVEIIVSPETNYLLYVASRFGALAQLESLESIRFHKTFPF